MRTIKFMAWDKVTEKMYQVQEMELQETCRHVIVEGYDCALVDPVLLQYTGLKDKNGKEIYEYSELDGAYEVIFKDLRYRLRYIPNNDIIDLHDYWRDKNGEIEVTREYTKV